MTLSLDETVGYVSAGGRGTRLNGLFYAEEKTGIAKALLSIGSPEIKLIDHHINNLRHQGIENVVVATGDQSQVFEYVNDVYIGDSRVTATRSAEQLGTGGDLIEYTRRDEANRDIVVQNVDTILDIDLNVLLYEYTCKRKLGRIATIALTLNKEVPNEDAYAVSEFDDVLFSKEFNDNEDAEVSSLKYRASSTGAVAVEADYLRNNLWQPKDGQLSLYRHILKDAWEAGGLFAYDNGTKFFRDVGTIATWLMSQDDVELQRHLRYNDTK